MFLEHCSCKVDFNLTLPNVRGAQKFKMRPEGWPLVPILSKKWIAPAQTMLVAREDTVVSKLGNEKLKIAAAAAKAKAEANAAKEDQKANSSETPKKKPRK